MRRAGSSERERQQRDLIETSQALRTLQAPERERRTALLQAWAGARSKRTIRRRASTANTAALPVRADRRAANRTDASQRRELHGCRAGPATCARGRRRHRYGSWIVTRRVPDAGPESPAGRPRTSAAADRGWCGAPHARCGSRPDARGWRGRPAASASLALVHILPAEAGPEATRPSRRSRPSRECGGPVAAARGAPARRAPPGIGKRRQHRLKRLSSCTNNNNNNIGLGRRAAATKPTRSSACAAACSSRCCAADRPAARAAGRRHRHRYLAAARPRAEARHIDDALLQQRAAGQQRGQRRQRTSASACRRPGRAPASFEGIGSLLGSSPRGQEGRRRAQRAAQRLQRDHRGLRPAVLSWRRPASRRRRRRHRHGRRPCRPSGRPGPVGRMVSAKGKSLRSIRCDGTTWLKARCMLSMRPGTSGPTRAASS